MKFFSFGQQNVFKLAAKAKSLLFEIFVRNFCSKLLFENFVRKICSKNLFEKFVRKIYSKNLFENFVRKMCSNKLMVENSYIFTLIEAKVKAQSTYPVTRVTRLGHFSHFLGDS
jgi:hypothetical protein